MSLTLTMDSTTNQKRKLVPLLPNTMLKKQKPSVIPPQHRPRHVNISIQPPPMSQIHPKISHITPKIDQVSKPQTSLTPIETTPVVTTSPSPKVTTTIINKNPPNFFDQPKPRHLKSCSRCRKHKTKCNYINTQPNPCTSCSNKNLVCQLEIVIPVKRSNIIKNLSDNINELKSIVNDLIIKDRYLRKLCKDQGLVVEGLYDVEFASNTNYEDESTPMINTNTLSISQRYYDSTESDNYASTGEKEKYFANENQQNIKLEKYLDLPELSELQEIETTPPTSEASDFDIDLKHFKYEDHSDRELVQHPTEEILEKHEIALEEEKVNEEQDEYKRDYEEGLDNEINNNDYDLSTQIQLSILEEMPQFSIDFECSYSLLEILKLLDDFNSNYLEFIPIMDKITSPTILYQNSKLLFWTIIFVTSKSSNIYNNFIKHELIQLKWFETPNKISIVQSILLIANFPIKIELSETNDENDEFDATIFQWLQVSKDLSLQIGLNRPVKFQNEFSRRIDFENLKVKYRYNLWSFIFILGNFYGFKLGLKWDFNVDFILDSKRSEADSYVGKLVNITIFMNKLLNELIFDFKNLNGLVKNNNDLLVSSINIWLLNLQNLRKLINVDSDVELVILIDSINLILLLFEPIYEETNQLDDQNNDDNNNNAIKKRVLVNNTKIVAICSTMIENLQSLNIMKSPIYIKIITEFISCTLLKLNYSPFLASCDDNVNIVGDIWELFLGSIRILINLKDFKDSNILIKLLINFTSKLQLNDLNQLLSFQTDFNLFKSNLLLGSLFDFKNFIKLQEGGYTGTNNNSTQDEMEEFSKYNIDEKATLRRLNSSFLEDKNRLNKLVNDNSLNSTINSLVNGDLIDVLNHSQEENLNVLNNLLKTI